MRPWLCSGASMHALDSIFAKDLITAGVGGVGGWEGGGGMHERPPGGFACTFGDICRWQLPLHLHNEMLFPYTDRLTDTDKQTETQTRRQERSSADAKHQLHSDLPRLFAAEDMLAAIAHATGCLVGVPVRRLETVRLAGLPEHLFTTDNSATRIRYAPQPLL